MFYSAFLQKRLYIFLDISLVAARTTVAAITTTSIRIIQLSKFDDTPAAIWPAPYLSQEERHNNQDGAEHNKKQNKKQNKKAPAIILVGPQMGENIGMAARAMANFALTDLRLVAPRDGWPNSKASSAAANARHIVSSARCFETLEDAIGDLHVVFATTARPRDMTKPVVSPEQGALMVHEYNEEGRRCGLLFGRENSGLTNDEVALADHLLIAPVNPQFASLNLAQAVLLFCYEWYKHEAVRNENYQGLGRETEFDGPALPGRDMRGAELATKSELVGFFEHLETELDASGFLRPIEKRPTMTQNIRNMFHRMEASAQEVKTLRGIVASLTRRHKRDQG